MDENHFSGDPPTGEVFIGYERGQWPLRIFAEAAHAAGWLTNKDDRDRELSRCVWRYRLTDPVLMELVPAQRIAATLKEAHS
jgi:hypothetical protein